MDSPMDLSRAATADSASAVGKRTVPARKCAAAPTAAVAATMSNEVTAAVCTSSSRA